MRAITFKFLHCHEIGLACDNGTLQQIIWSLWHYTRIIILYHSILYFILSPSPTTPSSSLVVSAFFCYSLSLTFCPTRKKFVSLIPICCSFNTTTVFRGARVFAKMAYLLRHVRQSVRLYQRGSQWTDFREI